MWNTGGHVGKSRGGTATGSRLLHGGARFECSYYTTCCCDSQLTVLSAIARKASSFKLEVMAALLHPSAPPCELCSLPANLLCPSDDACLCWLCDSLVHGANFLVARHRRAFLCCSCSSPTPCFKSGLRLPAETHFCPRCSLLSSEPCPRDDDNDDERSGITAYIPSSGSSSNLQGLDDRDRVFKRRRGKHSRVEAARMWDEDQFVVRNKRRLKEVDYDSSRSVVSDSVSQVDDEPCYETDEQELGSSQVTEKAR